jgi:SAM-dependent methyltransferase
MIKIINFILEYLKFKKNNLNRRFELSWKNRYPCLDDKTGQTSFDRHYIYHTAWAARILSKTKPKKHVDISSSLYFSSLVSAFIPIDFYDFRPADLKLSNLYSGKADLLSLPFKENSVISLSCMHTIEHVGLGRYGDMLDSKGDLMAIKELIRVLSPGGSLLFVVPIGGKAKIMFNAHRIYTSEQILKYFSQLKLKQFALIPEKAESGGLIINPSSKILANQNYACGCFWFIKNKL